MLRSGDTMQISKLLVGLFFLAGAVLLGGMIWQVGMAGFRTSLQALGFWVGPFVLLETIPICLHTAGWAACFQNKRHRIRLWQLYLVRLAGSAINQVTPTATIGGEVVKVLLLKPSLPREQAAASVVIDKASISLAQILYLALGTLYLTGRLPLPEELRLGLSLTLGLISLGLVGFVASQRYGLLSRLVHGLGCLKIGQGRLQRLSQRLIPLDTHLIAYYTTRPWRFVGSIAWHFLAFAFDGAKTYILLRFLLRDNAPGFAHAVMVAVAVNALDQMFFFVPARLGTLEGIRFTVLSALGVAQVYGLAFGLVSRLDTLFWNGLGLLAYALCTHLPLLPRPPKPATTASSGVPSTMC
jgi:uncharacterized protein (TIRG00374 family)